MTTRDIGITILQLGGLGLLVLGAYLTSVPVGLAVTGLALLAVGWALDRE